MSDLFVFLFKRLGISHTFSKLKRLISTLHITEKSSLNELRSLLTTYRLESMVVKLGKAELSEVPLPALVVLSEENRTSHAVLETLEKEKVKLFIGGKTTYWSLEHFLKEWTGYTILIKKNEHSGEPNFEANQQKERKDPLFEICGRMVDNL